MEGLKNFSPWSHLTHTLPLPQFLFKSHGLLANCLGGKWEGNISMQNSELLYRKKSVGRLVTIYFLQYIIPFQLSHVSGEAPHFSLRCLRNISLESHSFSLSFTSISLFNCPSHACLPLSYWSTCPHLAVFRSQGETLQIMLNMINILNSLKYDMHELQWNLFYFPMKCFCIMRKKMSSMP